MHCHCGTNNRAQQWTFTDPCKPEVRPGAREESASPAWLAAPAMNARDTTKSIYIATVLDRKWYEVSISKHLQKTWKLQQMSAVVYCHEQDNLESMYIL